jgi:hypothetical protein
MARLFERRFAMNERRIHRQPASLSLARCQLCSKLFLNCRDSVTTIRSSLIVDTALFILPLLSQVIHLRTELRDHLLQIFDTRKLFANRRGQFSRHAIG